MVCQDLVVLGGALNGVHLMSHRGLEGPVGIHMLGRRSQHQVGSRRRRTYRLGHRVRQPRPGTEHTASWAAGAVKKEGMPWRWLAQGERSLKFWKCKVVSWGREVLRTSLRKALGACKGRNDCVGLVLFAHETRTTWDTMRCYAMRPSRSKIAEQSKAAIQVQVGKSSQQDVKSQVKSSQVTFARGEWNLRGGHSGR